MGQLAKCMLRKNEQLMQDSRITILKAGVVVNSCNQSAGEAEAEIPGTHELSIVLPNW